MVYISPQKEKEIRKKLISFLRKKYKCKIHKNKRILPLFAPDYYTIQSNKKKRIFIFRNPPNLPEQEIGSIKSVLSKDMGVYIVIYYDKEDGIITKFQSNCEKLGIGIINYSEIDRNNFKIMCHSIIDFPQKDDIIDGRIKVFISSKLWIDERDTARDVIKKLKHQQIQIERLVLNGPLEEECIKWVDKSQFLVGIITPQYSELMDKEIRRALLKKPKKTLVYVNTECEDLKDKKLCSLIKRVKEKKVFRGYINNVDIKRKMGMELHDFISQVSVEALKNSNENN